MAAGSICSSGADVHVADAVAVAAGQLVAGPHLAGCPQAQSDAASAADRMPKRRCVMA